MPKAANGFFGARICDVKRPALQSPTPPSVIGVTYVTGFLGFEVPGRVEPVSARRDGSRTQIRQDANDSFENGVITGVIRSE